MSHTLRPLVQFFAPTLLRRRAFERIYHRFEWSHGQTESRSGPGSTLEATTRARSFLTKVIAETGVRHVTDAPCGDFRWFQHVSLPAGVQYVGYDIVRPLVVANTMRHGRRGVRFEARDVVGEGLEATDLVVARDFLRHLPLRDGARFVGQVRKSGARYLVATTYPEQCRNEDVDGVVGSRPVNLEIAPFGLPSPVAFIEEDDVGTRAVEGVKHLALFDLRVGS